ncbi:hypothetical protein NEOLEDRAFT_167932 [Neolentinus lepideus HHB14362 ss-1]|uniref:Uncharacterized protein n=1 Tax=Neolentinus lepideus HHB14362 ss-1 TaxID=1314782 RepID=A0A165MKV5_9AGAM|nr:hypothetical protein NEOLEDRAFT_167932 [Neolentinus lepideus HHB14362 ss-1]
MHHSGVGTEQRVRPGSSSHVLLSVCVSTPLRVYSSPQASRRASPVSTCPPAYHLDASSYSPVSMPLPTHPSRRFLPCLPVSTLLTLLTRLDASYPAHPSQSLSPRLPASTRLRLRLFSVTISPTTLPATCDPDSESSTRTPSPFLSISLMSICAISRLGLVVTMLDSEWL